jgi:ABC-type sulfate/molybdate transport systems ATPase subunit
MTDPDDIRRSIDIVEAAMPYLLPRTGDRPKWTVTHDLKDPHRLRVSIWLVQDGKIKDHASTTIAPHPDRTTAKEIVDALERIVAEWERTEWAPLTPGKTTR